MGTLPGAAEAPVLSAAVPAASGAQLVHAHDQQGQQPQQQEQQQERGQVQPGPCRPARPPGHTSALCSALAAGVEGLLCGLGQLPPALNPGLPRQLGVLLANPMLDGCEHHE